MIIGIDIRLIGKKQTGSEAVFFNLVKELARIDTDHRFKLFTDITDQKILGDIAKQLEIVEKKNFEIISLEAKNKFSWNFWTLPKYLRKNPVDIYETQYITPFFISRKIKIITIIHDISFNFFPQLIKKRDLFFLKVLIPLSIRRADRVIGVSQFTCDEIAKYYKTDKEKIILIPNAVSDDFLSKRYSEAELEEVSKKYDLPKKFILYIGTLQPRKNVPQLISAFARITDKMPGVKLVICGNKAHNYDRAIDTRVEEFSLSEKVKFTGFVEEKDKKALFMLADSFVFPSLYEGFGIPVLEALSQKIPTLCSDIPSFKEIAGEGALFFDLESLDDFSKKLYDISMDDKLRSELIRAGEERVSFFSWQKTAEKTLALYEKLS